MKEILIVNLTRMGDLLQTTPLMAGLKEQYRDARITLLVSSRFAEICSGIPLIDDLIVFDMHGFRDRLMQKEHDLVGNYLFLKRLISRLNEKEYDLAINVTHSSVSALIISLVHAREIRGFTIDSEGHRVIRHPWLKYFFNVVPNRDYNPFHLVDMYLKAGDVMPERKGLIYEVRDEDRVNAEEILLKEGIRNEDSLVGIHLGASKSDKTWPVSSFVEVADMISREYHARVILFGSSTEADLGEKFTSAANCKPVNLIGKTSLGELAALLKQCSVLISNDTGPLHLATAVGTTVVDIFTANVHFLETSPYGEGHYVIQSDLPCVPCGFDVQCNNMKCKDAITPQIVCDTVKTVLNNKAGISANKFLMPEHVQIYRTYFRENGMLGFYPIKRKEITREILYRILYRAVWDMDIHMSSNECEAACNGICDELSSCCLLSRAWSIVCSLKEDAKALARLNELAGQGLGIIDRICEEAGRDAIEINLLKELSDRLESVDRELELAGHAYPCFRPLLVVFVFSREALEGSGLSALANSSKKIYEELFFRSLKFLQVMKKIITFMESKSENEQEPRPETIHETACRGCDR
ncbi:MAG: hypothetical protein C4538_07225 [Nitrospiraceae bacterium]|nr:MAG: hypothetical protein C4538_07225 [Nitrospiraceae bacterium]